LLSHVGGGAGIMLTGNASVASDAGGTVAVTAGAVTSVAQQQQRCVADADTVVASLRYKMIHCVDEQRELQQYRSFEQLLNTPQFVASIDRWP